MGKIKKYSLIQRSALLALLFVCLVPLSSLAQTIQLTGTVTDTKGETLIGASVLEKVQPMVALPTSTVTLH